MGREPLAPTAPLRPAPHGDPSGRQHPGATGTPEEPESGGAGGVCRAGERGKGIWSHARCVALVGPRVGRGKERRGRATRGLGPRVCSGRARVEQGRLPVSKAPAASGAPITPGPAPAPYPRRRRCHPLPPAPLCVSSRNPPPPQTPALSPPPLPAFPRSPVRVWDPGSRGSRAGGRGAAPGTSGQRGLGDTHWRQILRGSFSPLSSSPPSPTKRVPGNPRSVSRPFV